jgi:hypothetical protein
MVAKKEALADLFVAFAALSDDMKLAVSVAAIVASYFGGAMYFGGPSSSDSRSAASRVAIDTPASCDRSVDFEVPKNIPADDKDFFEMIFTK